MSIWNFNFLMSRKNYNYWRLIIYMRLYTADFGSTVAKAVRTMEKKDGKRNQHRMVITAFFSTVPLNPHCRRWFLTSKQKTKWYVKKLYLFSYQLFYRWCSLLFQVRPKKNYFPAEGEFCILQDQSTRLRIFVFGQKSDRSRNRGYS